MKGRCGINKETKTAKKGSRYVCNVCGMAVTVDNVCSCTDCDIMCCGQKMVLKK